MKDYEWWKTAVPIMLLLAVWAKRHRSTAKKGSGNLAPDEAGPVPLFAHRGAYFLPSLRHLWLCSSFLLQRRRVCVLVIFLHVAFSLAVGMVINWGECLSKASREQVAAAWCQK